MHARFTADAETDLDLIQGYLEPENPIAFQRIISAIFTTIGQLESFPLMGRPGRVPGTYEITVPRTPYFIVYSLSDNTFIDIDRVLHSRRLYPLTGD